MDGGAVLAFEFDGDPFLAREFSAKAVPAVIDVGGLELKADAVHEVIGEHRDQQMSADTMGLVVKNRTEAQLRFEAAEHRLQIGQHRIGAP